MHCLGAMLAGVQPNAEQLWLKDPMCLHHVPAAVESTEDANAHCTEAVDTADVACIGPILAEDPITRGALPLPLLLHRWVCSLVVVVLPTGLPLSPPHPPTPTLPPPPHATKPRE
jgi:hypothetical protein